MDQEEGDPQSWNLYSYVRNNPLRFSDPTGTRMGATTAVEYRFEAEAAEFIVGFFK